MNFLLPIIALAAVFYPVWVWFANGGEMFPVFGIIAFTIMWLHVVGSSFEPKIKKYYDFEKFVHLSSYIVLVCIILHPLLLLIKTGLSVFQIYDPRFIWLAIFGWLLLITYDIGKIFREKQFFVRHWEAVKIISTIGFFAIFFHSLTLGSDLQAGHLRILWIFYFVSALISTIYTFIIKKYWK